MNKQILNASYLIILSSFLVACSQSKNDKHVSHISPASTLASGLTSEAKSENLSDQAEDLLIAQGLEEAYKVNELALKQNPTNAKAQFLKAILEPQLLSKGILARVKPLAEKSEFTKNKLAQEIKYNENRPETQFKNFFVQEGLPDITTEEELQKLLDQLQSSAEKSKSLLKKLGSQEVVVKATTVLVKDIEKRFADACEIKETANLEYELTCPKSEDRNKVALNEADYFTIQQSITGYQLYLASLNQYVLNGIVNDEIMGKELPLGKIFSILMKGSQFGKYRPQNLHQQVPKKGIEAVAGARWMMRNQSQLCSSGENTGTNRPGMYFNSGICLPAMLQVVVDDLEELFKGTPRSYIGNSAQTALNVQYSPMNYFMRPLKSLKDLGNVTVDRCGNLNSMDDDTGGGIFPAGGVNKLLVLQSQNCDEAK